MTSKGLRMIAPVCTLTGLSRGILAGFILIGAYYNLVEPPRRPQPLATDVRALLLEPQKGEEIQAVENVAPAVVEHPREPATSRGAPRGLQVTLEASAYTCGPESTGKRPVDPGYCVTASGYRLRPDDKVVAMGKKYPFGTQVMIPGYGLATVRDRGSAISDGHVDLYFERLEDALRWGRRSVTATILPPGE